jgi:hypothetical protein
MAEPYFGYQTLGHLLLFKKKMSSKSNKHFPWSLPGFWGVALLGVSDWKLS